MGKIIPTVEQINELVLHFDGLVSRIDDSYCECMELLQMFRALDFDSNDSIETIIYLEKISCCLNDYMNRIQELGSIFNSYREAYYNPEVYGPPDFNKQVF